MQMILVGALGKIISQQIHLLYLKSPTTGSFNTQLGNLCYRISFDYSTQPFAIVPPYVFLGAVISSLGYYVKADDAFQFYPNFPKLYTFIFLIF